MHAGGLGASTVRLGSSGTTRQDRSNRIKLGTIRLQVPQAVTGGNFFDKRHTSCQCSKTVVSCPEKGPSLFIPQFPSALKALGSSSSDVSELSCSHPPPASFATQRCLSVTRLRAAQCHGVTSHHGPSPGASAQKYRITRWSISRRLLPVK